MSPSQPTGWRCSWVVARLTGFPLLKPCLLLLLSVYVLWPGMDGPLVHDDHRNLSIFFEAKPDYRTAILENDSGPLGRAVTMASFALNRLADAKLSVRALKISNLFLHILNGLLIYIFVSNLLSYREEGAWAGAIPLATTGIWLLNPVNTETVFYVIQRATVLATTFMLLASLAYIRLRTLTGTPPAATLFWGFVCLLFWLCAIFSKENALLLPLALLLIELYLFEDLKLGTLARFVMFIALPLTALALLLLRNSEYLDYAGLPFSLTERLFIQALVVLSYVRESLLPLGVETGLFRDDFTVVKGLWNMPVVSVASLFVGLVIYGIFNLRRKTAFIAFAVLFFFSGHLLESTIFPLELYYRHRNYFPSVGMSLLVVMLLCAFVHRLLIEPRAKQILVNIIMLSYCLFLANASFLQARTWSSYDAILLNSYERHPGSVRLSLELTGRLLRQGDIKTALQINAAIINARPVLGLPAKIQRFYIYCEHSLPVPTGEYRILERDMNLYHPHLVSNALGLFVESYRARKCLSVDLDKIVGILKTWSDNSREAGAYSIQQLWTLDYYINDMLQLLGREQLASQRLAQLASLDSAGAAHLLKNDGKRDKVK